MTRTQFIVAMAVEIGVAGNLPARRAVPLASAAYRAFEEGCEVEFGDPGFAWDEDAARIVAREYEINHWEMCA
ncbi:hypothetical protein [Methylobacterium goesingense]|uniref:Uncharacterized protein n=1 Tax=Methylobacterium goesingense TaxID=243690 RepID=A0ABV2L1J9_9HYPH|nr:hypothetical protein [Methylobacterium goesingense]GJD72604.1 hypothetical protein CFIICLFH_0821 [Methylobacterium goesingense]